MILTRKALTALKEDSLTKEVLIPLFKEMGFQDVKYYGGGSQEHGKDIVMWKPDQDGMRPRVNYAVVVKVTKITGKAKGSSSAGEVRMQIEECFTIPIIDPVTTKKQSVDKCWVVTSNEITKEARANLRGILEERRLSTDFIDGEHLWELVKTHLSGPTALAKIQEVQDQFNEADPDWRPFVITRGGETIVSIEPKHANARPLSISVRAGFPNTPEGQERQAAVERHMQTGAPVTLESNEIQEFSLPPFMETLINPTGLSQGPLTFTPHRSSRTWHVKAVVESNIGESVEVGYIELQVARGGKEEVTFDNAHHRVPWRFQIIINYKEHRLNFQYGMDLVGRSTNTAVEALKFDSAVRKGGTLKVYDLNTGIEMFPPMPLAEQPPALSHDAWLKLFEDVLFIQKKISIPIFLPKRDLNQEDWIAVQNILQILRTGRISADGDLKLEVVREGAKNILEAFKKDGSLRAGPVQGYQQIFDTEIPLGPETVTCLQACIPEEDIPHIRKAIDSAKVEDTVSICFRPSGEYPMEATYHNWLPPSKKQKE